HPAQHLALARPGGRGRARGVAARRPALGQGAGQRRAHRGAGGVSAPTLFMAGGGTGGHVFPLLAVARAVKESMPELQLVFIGTDRGIESKVIPQAGFQLELMPTAPFRGGGISGASRGMLSVARSLPRARELLKKYAPKAVFSVGGYAAVPISIGARLAGAPLALMEPNE